MEKLHPIQKSILEVAGKYDLQKMSLGKIARLVGESYPQTAKYHISRLKKKGLLSETLKPRYPSIHTFQKENSQNFVSLPIVGAVNCGEATVFAEENLEGFLKVSPKIVGNNQQVFILRAEGDSMDKADVYGRNIENGDYVLVDAGRKTPRTGEYIVSIIDGMANIKKFFHDTENDQILLLSESTKDYPPICIHTEDFPDYTVAGIVKQVIKPPKVEETKYEPVSG